MTAAERAAALSDAAVCASRLTALVESLEGDRGAVVSERLILVQARIAALADREQERRLDRWLRAHGRD